MDYTCEMQKKIIIIESFVILLLVITLSVVLVNPRNISEKFREKVYKPNQMYVEYGDFFSGFELTSYDGAIVSEIPEGKISAVAYLSDTCSSCVNILGDFNRFSEIYGDEINYLIIWTDNIPYSLIEKYEIADDINYSLSNKTNLSTSTPTFFILDENNQIVFRDVERTNLIKKLIELEVVDTSTLQKNATAYIAKAYYGSTNIHELDKKIIYFYMQGCPDCEKIDELFRESEFSEFDFLYIYKYDSNEAGGIIDKDKLFASVYGITWYPSLLVIKNGEIKMIGEMPIDQIVEEIMK